MQPVGLATVNVTNSTATIYYFRLYDEAVAPTPANDSANVKQTYSAPATGAVTPNLGSGLAMLTGIAFCLTGAIADTDNTNAATGVAINLSYK